MNYTNREVVRRLKQYDMFLNSLNLTKDENMKERICDQLDKIEKQILLETNTEYEEEYMHILGEEAGSFDEEKDKLHHLINTIEERRKYLDERKENHKKITGSLVELTNFLGEDKLSIFKRRLEIIETYEKNKEEQEKIMNEMKSLDIKISEASRNVKANARLDDILENKMIELVGNSLEKLNLYTLASKEDEIEEKHKILDYALNMAKENLKSAKEINNTYMILECDNILSEVTIEYNEYHEKLYALKLMNIYDSKVEDYDALFKKREEINNILKEIPESPLFNEINEELSKEYSTIKMQKQDLDTYESLKNERLKKRERLTTLEEQNTSPEFKAVLDELIKNEARIKEEKMRLAKKKEYQEKQAKMLEEQKLEASRRRRQKLIEEARMKEQQERLNKVKDLQKNSVIHGKKEEEINNPLKDLDLDTLFGKKSDNLDIESPKEKSILEEMAEEIKEDKEEKPQELFDKVEDNHDMEVTFDDIDIKDEEENKEVEPNDFDDIPVIENNNLKPELLDKEKDDFPILKGKEGEILWKETL